MAQPNPKLINAIRKTSLNLREGSPYQWGHMGCCNCGNLAQELSHLSKKEIHEYAMRKYGNWSDQANEYCPNSGFPLDQVISIMLKAGLSIEDIRHLEKLSDPKILKHLPGKRKHLIHNQREDVILYLNTWADLLEKESREMEHWISNAFKDERDPGKNEFIAKEEMTELMIV